MALRAVKFTASGVIRAASIDDEVSGVTYKGFTSVTVYSGVDNTGTVILAGGTAPQTLSFDSPIAAPAGVYVEVAGSGSGSVLL